MNILKKIKSLTESSNNFSIVIQSIVLFYFIILFYGIIIFQQFSVIEILTVSFCFIFIFIFLGREVFTKAFKFNFINIIISLILTTIMLVIFFNDPTWLNDYYYTYPILETDLGAFWHEDTAFHTSIIQSIIHFGYPSVALHDVVPTYYHVLSHYIDALIIILVDIEPYDSYGLLFYFKKLLLISSVVFFIMKICYKHNILILLLLVVFLSPFIIYTWHSIGSQGLWFPTILLLFFLPNVVKRLESTTNKNKDFIFIFLFVILISLGKVSTGFMLGVFLGLFLLFKNLKDFRIYVVGIFWIIFFLFFSYLLAPTNGKLVIDEIHRFKYDGIISFLFNIKAEYFINLLLIYIMIFISLFLGFFYKNYHLKLFSYSLIVSLLPFLILIKIGLFSIHDIWYFTYGLYSISSLIFLVFFLNILSSEEFKYKKIFFSFFISLLIIGNIYLFSNYYLVEQAIGKFYTGYFNRLNSRLDSVSKYYSIKKVYLDNYKINFPYNPNGLEDFRKALREYMKMNDLNYSNTLLFIPRNVYESELNEKVWARGMLVYAVTGIPLLNGVGDHRSGYGFGIYDENNLYTNQFNKEILCKTKKKVIIVNSLKNKSFEELCH